MPVKTKRMFKRGIVDEAQTEMYGIGTVAEMVSVPIKKLRYYIHKNAIPVSVVKRGGRKYFAFTDAQVVLAISFFMYQAETRKLRRKDLVDHT